jgi:hypothetical protein
MYAVHVNIKKVGKLVCPAVAVKTSLFIVACGVGIVPI